MQASNRDLDALQKIQEIDLEIRKLQRTWDDLPQRDRIATLKEKIDAFEAQSEKIEKIKISSDKKRIRIQDEDASLAKKEAGVQAAIEAAHGDFRNVQARTRELESINRRRTTLADDLSVVEEELKKLDGLNRQVEKTLDQLRAQQQEQMESYDKEGGQLQDAIAERKTKREEIAASVDPKIMTIYEKISAQTGGVAIGALEGSRCGVCHIPLEVGRLIELRAEAPLGQCPSCKRLLIVNPEEPSEEDA